MDFVEKECIVGFGHENIQAVHPSTLMFTKEKRLSKNGDCVVAVSADKSVADLSQNLKVRLKKLSTKVKIIVDAGGLKEEINAIGSPNLILTHPTDIVIRKSDYISDRTLAILADKSSNDFSRELVEKLKNSGQKVSITLAVYG